MDNTELQDLKEYIEDSEELIEDSEYERYSYELYEYKQQEHIS